LALGISIRPGRGINEVDLENNPRLAEAMLWLRQLLPLGLAAILLCLGHGAAAYPQAFSPWACVNNESTCRSVSIVHNSWHAAIVLRKSDLPERTMPELADFPAAQFIEFSWGDKDYFPDPQSGVVGAIKAALWSSGSVIHLVGFTDTVEYFYRGANIAELRLNRTAYERMVDYIDETFLRERSSGRARAAPGLFSYSRFYPASRSFSLLHTCNTWVAEALEQAGLSISPAFVITAGNLHSQLSAIKPMP
jgi:uncharacterized protein (TIGR02117 family)